RVQAGCAVPAPSAAGLARRSAGGPSGGRGQPPGAATAHARLRVRASVPALYWARALPRLEPPEPARTAEDATRPDATRGIRWHRGLTGLRGGRGLGLGLRSSRVAHAGALGRTTGPALKSEDRGRCCP